jgi:hypothetical protein
MAHREFAVVLWERSIILCVQIMPLSKLTHRILGCSPVFRIFFVDEGLATPWLRIP